MKRLTFVSLLTIVGCGGAGGDADLGPASLAHDSAHDSAQDARPALGSTPAGIYFRHHTYDTCEVGEACPTPRVAVLEVVSTPAEAERSAAGLSGLAPGYPLVVHTDELGLAHEPVEGIAVVAGLFSSRDEARVFLEDRAPTSLRLADLADSDEAFDRLFAESDERQQRVVVRVALDRSAKAYAKSVIEDLYYQQDLQARGETEWLVERFGRLTPLCTVAPGSVALSSHDELGTHYYEWAPARCGDEPAYVRWNDTLLTSTVTTDEDGAIVLRQIVSVECDQAFIEARPYAP